MKSFDIKAYSLDAESVDFLITMSKYETQKQLQDVGISLGPCFREHIVYQTKEGRMAGLALSCGHRNVKLFVLVSVVQQTKRI